MNYLIYIILLISFNVNQTNHLTCKNVVIKHVGSNIDFKRCAFQSEFISTVSRLQPDTVFVVNEVLREIVDYYHFGACEIEMPRNTDRYSPSIMLNGNEFEVLINDSISLKVGEVLDKSIFSFAPEICEFSPNKKVLEIVYYWESSPNKYIKTDNTLKIEYDSGSTIIYGIIDRSLY